MHVFQHVRRNALASQAMKMVAGVLLLQVLLGPSLFVRWGSSWRTAIIMLLILHLSFLIRCARRIDAVRYGASRTVAFWAAAAQMAMQGNIRPYGSNCHKTAAGSSSEAVSRAAKTSWRPHEDSMSSQSAVYPPTTVNASAALQGCAQSIWRRGLAAGVSCCAQCLYWVY
jgi:hypothetical protein